MVASRYVAPRLVAVPRRGGRRKLQATGRRPTTCGTRAARCDMWGSVRSPSALATGELSPISGTEVGSEVPSIHRPMARGELSPILANSAARGLPPRRFAVVVGDFPPSSGTC